MKPYWDQRFQQEGMIWGVGPSPTAKMARSVFQQHDLKEILVPGAGYGRNTKELSPFFHVDAIELSSEGIQLGKKWDPETRFIHGSVLDSELIDKEYDGIYCYDVLHLFLQADRIKLVDQCYARLRSEGLLFMTCFSEKDSNNGVGTQIEEGTYEYKAGKYAHFFTEEDLLNHFVKFTILDTGLVDERLVYANSEAKQYCLRYLIARKP